MGRPHPGLARGDQFSRLLFRIETNSCMMLLILNEIGDTLLPPRRPEMLDDDLWK